MFLYRIEFWKRIHVVQPQLASWGSITNLQSFGINTLSTSFWLLVSCFLNSRDWFLCLDGSMGRSLLVIISLREDTYWVSVWFVHVCVYIFSLLRFWGFFIFYFLLKKSSAHKQCIQAYLQEPLCEQ